MVRSRGHGDGEPVVFESVGIGPTGGDPTEFVPVGDDESPDTDDAPRRVRVAALVVGFVVLFAVTGWAVFGRGSHDATESVWPAIPTDPTEAFVWTADGPDPSGLSVGGSADTVIVLTTAVDAGTIIALNADGSERWRATTDYFAHGEVKVRGDDVITILDEEVADDGTVTVISFDAENGRRHWETTARGFWRFEHDGRLLVMRPAGSDNAGDSRFDQPQTITSIDLASGQRSEPVLVDSFVPPFANSERSVVIQRDGEAMFVDGALEPVSTPVPGGDGSVGGGNEQILTINNSEIIVYDTAGAVVHSAPVPPFLDESAPLVLGAADDVWYYSDLTTFEAGAFRFDADGVPVELWHHDDLLLLTSITFSSPSGDDTGPFGMAAGFGDSDRGDQQLIDFTSGDVVRRAAAMAPGANGIVAETDGHLTGYVTPQIEQTGRARFGLDVGDTPDWELLDGAIAIITTSDGPTSVTVYS